MSEEDLTKLLVRVDIPDIKTQVITADQMCAGNHNPSKKLLCCVFVAVHARLYVHADFKSNGTLVGS